MHIVLRTVHLMLGLILSMTMNMHPRSSSLLSSTTTVPTFPSAMEITRCVTDRAIPESFPRKRRSRGLVRMNLRCSIGLSAFFSSSFSHSRFHALVFHSFFFFLFAFVTFFLLSNHWIAYSRVKMGKVFDAAEGILPPTQPGSLTSSIDANYYGNCIVAKHASSESCWVILYGKVYDVRDSAPYFSLSPNAKRSFDSPGHRFPLRTPWWC